MASPEQDSIFELGNQLGVESPFGNWLQADDKIGIRDIHVGVSKIRQTIHTTAASENGSFPSKVALVISVGTFGPVQAVLIPLNGLLYSGRPIVDPLTESNLNTNTFFVEIDVTVPPPWQVYDLELTVTAKSATGNEVSKTIITKVDRAGVAKLHRTFERPECLCKGNWDADTMRSIVEHMRKGELIGGYKFLRDVTSTKYQKDGDFVLDANGNKIKYPLTQYDSFETKVFTLKMAEQIPEPERNMASLARVFNAAFEKAKLNTCLLRVHFLAQCYHETQRFLKLYESDPRSSVSGGDHYRGRGFIQITHDYNYREFYKSLNGTDPTGEQLSDFAPSVATSIDMAMKASAWYWKKMNLSQYAMKDDVVKLSAAINYPKALSGEDNDVAAIKGIEERKLFTELAKAALNYEECKNR